MAGLQRSAQTFRRSGSSGLVWDERFLTEDCAAGHGRRQHQHQPALRHSRSVGSLAMLRRGGGAGGEVDRDDKKRKLLVVLANKPNHKGHHHRKKQEELVVNGTGRKAFWTKDVAPNTEPPSPRAPAGCCAPCAIFRDASAGGGGAGGSSAVPRRAKKR